MTDWYRDELDTHNGFQWLARIRDWYRANILFKWPEWMPGTLVLVRRLDKKMYLMQQAIEHKIWSRRLFRYREELKFLNDNSYRACRGL